MAARSKAYVCGPWIDGIAGWNPAEGMDIGHLCVVGSDLCDVLIARSEQPYRVSMCDLESSTMRTPRP